MSHQHNTLLEKRVEPFETMNHQVESKKIRMSQKKDQLKNHKDNQEIFNIKNLNHKQNGNIKEQQKLIISMMKIT